MELLVIAILLTVTGGAQQSRMEGPQNTLGIVGSNVTLRCLTPSGNCIGVDWEKSTPQTNPETIFTDRPEVEGILNEYRDRYSVDNSSGCDLVITDVELTDAGRLTCRVLISARTYEKSAYLFVLKNEPKCTNNASLNGPVEGDGVQLTCEVAYNGTGRVSLLWKDVENALAPAKSGETISQSYSVVASAPEVPSFTCVTSFEAEGVVDGSAWNTPTIACETQAIKVLYPVRNVTLSPSFSYYFPGTTITCSAKGHPSPGFKWQVRESGNEETWMDIHNQNNSEFVVSNVTSRPYRCVAMNVVRGRNYSAHSSEFQVNRPGYLPPIVPIAFGVAVGFLVLIILFNICFCVRSCPGYRCCHSEKKSKYKIRFSSRQRKHRRDIPSAGTTQPCQHGGQHDSVYESLGDDIGTNTYESVA